MQVNILDAKNRLSELIKSAQAGNDVVIANRGEPVVRLVPTQAGDVLKAVPGSASALLMWLENNPPPSHRRRSHKDIQAGIREERTGWE